MTLLDDCKNTQISTVIDDMELRDTGEVTSSVTASSINGQVYIELLKTILIPSTERMFADDDIIFPRSFQDCNASC